MTLEVLRVRSDLGNTLPLPPIELEDAVQRA